MDANVTSATLDELVNGIETCQKRLNECITTVKGEFRIVDHLLAGEQFEQFKSYAENTCEAINVTIESLGRSKEFLKALREEVISYGGTKYGG